MAFASNAINNKIVLPVKTISATTYTLQPGDQGSILLFTSATGCAVSIDTFANQAIPAGSRMELVNASGGNTGVVTVTALAGVAINNSYNLSVGGTQNGRIVMETSFLNEWDCVYLYEETSFNTNWSGIWASPQSGNCHITRINSTVTIKVPAVLATASVATIITSVSALQARFIPLQNTYGLVPAYNNAANTDGGFQIDTGGSIYFYAISGTNPFGNYAGAGNSGTSAQPLKYTVS